jgi:hypothetical protein
MAVTPRSGFLKNGQLRNWEAGGGDAYPRGYPRPRFLKITQCFLIRLENFLFYLILQGLPKFAF